jgi:hypothetical protein
VVEVRARLVLDVEFDLEVVAVRVRRAVTELYCYHATARSVAPTGAALRDAGRQQR